MQNEIESFEKVLGFPACFGKRIAGNSALNLMAKRCRNGGFGVFPPGNQFGSGLDSPIELLVSKNTYQQQTTKTYQNFCFKSFQSITG